MSRNTLLGENISPSNSESKKILNPSHKAKYHSQQRLNSIVFNLKLLKELLYKSKPTI